MKKIYLPILAFMVSFCSKGQLALPIDFESEAITYAFTNFDGGNASRVDNPQKSGINTSNKVARMVKGPGGQVWGGAYLTTTAPIDFSTNKVMRMKVYSPRVGAKVLLKVENIGNDALFFQKEVLTTVANGWEDLMFDFVTINTANTYQKVIVIFDLGTVGDGSANYTFLYDDIKQEAPAPGTKTPPTLPVTFELETVDYTFENFAGGVSTVIDNPQKSGINTSNKVAQMVKNAGEVYGGSLIALLGPVDFAPSKIFRVKVFSPRVGAKVLLKLENGSNTAINFEVESTVGVANEWQDLSFNFNAIPANSYQKVILIFDNGTMGNGSANFTFLFDDIRLEAPVGGLTQMNLPVTFDDPTVDYGLIGFEGAEQSTIVTDPSNAANKVAKVIKTATAAPWAGTTITAAAQLGFSSKIPFSPGNTTMSARVWSPDAGIKVRMKVEDHTDVTKSVETEATTTVAAGWEKLVFDFTVPTNPPTAGINYAFNYTKASIFFNYGVEGATPGEKTYYFDSVAFGGDALPPTPSNKPVLPVTFESETIVYAFANFDGGVTTVMDNPQKSGINTSNKVAQMVKNAGQPHGGSVLELAGPIDFASSKTFRMKVYSPRVGAKVLLKVENQSNAGQSHEVEVLTTVANAWEDMTFDYAGVNMANSYSKVVLIFDNGTPGDGSANFTFLVDDLRLEVAPTSNLPVLPLQFETPAIDYTFNDFDGGATTVIDNPQKIGINTSDKVARMVKSAGQVWGGSLIALATPIDFTTLKSFRMKVYSPRVGAKVLLKVENATDNTISFQREVSTTVANAWEDLTFDYAAINIANQYQKLVFIFDDGTVGDGSANFTFLFDDVRLLAAGSSGLTQMSLPVTFDDPTVEYGLISFGSAASSIVEDPTNAANKVGRTIKGPGSAEWAGATLSAPGNPEPGFSTKIPFVDGNASITIRVWSPDAGIPVLLKAEINNDPTKSVETLKNTTVAGAWENLTFNFANERTGTAAINYSINYNKLSIFFNFLVINATDKTYYFDDIVFGSNPLPVKLLSFTAEKQENTVMLKWSTAFEINNKGFDVERNTDGNKWSIIATVPGTGNHNTVRKYEVKDHMPLGGLNQYRIRQTDFDGKLTYSAIRSIDFSGVDVTELKVYPNPATDRLMILSNAFEGRVNYSVLSAMGTILTSGVIANTHSPSAINVSNLPTGVYYLRLRDDKSSRTTKFVVQ